MLLPNKHCEVKLCDAGRRALSDLKCAKNWHQSSAADQEQGKNKTKYNKTRHSAIPRCSESRGGELPFRGMRPHYPAQSQLLQSPVAPWLPVIHDRNIC